LSINEKTTGKVVGTTECFARQEILKKLGRIGILRLALVSRLEKKEVISEILGVVNKNYFDSFQVQSLLTKAIPEAMERISALKDAGYREIDLPKIMPFSNYFVRTQ
jgi:hypothetical protein